MRFQKILCPTDFSPGSQQAMRVAARLATESNAELVLVHSWYIPAVAFADFAFPRDAIEQLAQDAERGLASALRDAKLLGVERVTAKLVNGLPWQDIVDVADKEACDLIVIGTHGRTGLKRILLGSVAEKVIRHAPCSVLAVRPDSRLTPFVHALCPTDFSESANHAVELAAEITTPNAAITLLHVIELPVAISGEMPVLGLERELDQRACEALKECAARLEASSKKLATQCSRLGYPGAQVLALLDKDPSIDIVVMGSHARTGIGRAILGSVAEKVARHARCPVLVTRPRR